MGLKVLVTGAICSSSAYRLDYSTKTRRIPAMSSAETWSRGSIMILSLCGDGNDR